MTGNIAVVGGGPAGLMAAEAAIAAGASVDLYEAKGSVGRKFLIAGRGGLNLTHSEPPAGFAARYGARSGEVARWLREFGPQQLREWARGLGIETFVGSSGRVFPLDQRAAPLLRAWVRRLREAGVRFHVGHRCLGFGAEGALRFDTSAGEREVHPDAVVLALGGGSWPQLGSDGDWQQWLGAAGAALRPLVPSNCGFDADWSPHFASRFAGAPVKPGWIALVEPDGARHLAQGEYVITSTGIEGSLVYALSAPLREAIATRGSAMVELDLAPGREHERLLRELSKPRGSRSFSEHLRRNAGIEGVRAGLLRELLPDAASLAPLALARRIKAAPLRLLRPRPLAEAISSAGGVALESMDPALMLGGRPGVFCAGEMLDWEAPTGGYLLSACFASGFVAGQGAARWIAGRAPLHAPPDLC
ncbi:MAG: TIGR03862 family flavoprotein [Arenimonas sp.]